MIAVRIQTIAFDARYVSDRYHGIGRHAYNLLEALSRLDPARRYVAFYHPAYPNTRFDLLRLGARSNVELRPTRLPLYSPSEQLLWPRLLARTEADLFHSPYIMLPFFGPTQSVITMHDVILEQHPEYRPRSYLSKCYGSVTQWCLRRASLVLTVSQATCCAVQALYGVDRPCIRVTGNGVDPAFKRQTDPVRLEAVRKRYGLPERFILTLGAGRPHKNVETLVEAFARLDPALAPALVIGGELDRRFPDTVGARIKARGITSRVIRPSMIHEADLPTVYSLADIFVFPSFEEGFGLPPLEAMACGTPVLASTTAAVSEAVGDAALAFDPHEVEQLATVMARALSDTALRASLSQRGIKRARAFTWERVAHKTLEAYRSVEIAR